MRTKAYFTVEGSGGEGTNNITGCTSTGGGGVELSLPPRTSSEVSFPKLNDDHQCSENAFLGMLCRQNISVDVHCDALNVDDDN